MKSEGEFGGAASAVLDRDEVEGVLSGAFYSPAPEAPRSGPRPASPRAASPRAASPRAAPRPEHYKVICISMYTSDLARLDEMVDELKAMGMTKANRSALIRHALASVDLQKVPRGL